MRKHLLDNRSHPDNDRVHDLFHSRSCSVIERWNWFQFGHTLREPANRGWAFGRWVADGIAVKLPASNWPNPSTDLFPVFLRSQGHTVHGSPSVFLSGGLVRRHSLRPVTNSVDLALRAIWVTALLEPTDWSLTKRIDSGRVGRSALPTHAFERESWWWRNLD